MVIPVSKPKVSQSEKKYRQEMFPDVKEIINKNLLCTSCGGSVNDLITKGKPIIHPFLETLLCEKCHMFYGDGQFSVDEDGSDKYCRWCGQGGTLFLCSKCSSGFCKRCVKRNLPKSAQAKIEDDDWVCYCCDAAPLYELRAQCWAAQQYATESVKNKGSSKNKKNSKERSKRSRDSGSSGSEGEVHSKKKQKESGGGGGGGRSLRKRDRKSNVKHDSGSDSNGQSEVSSGKTLPSGISVDRIHAALNKLSSFVVEIAGMTKETHKKLLECKNKKLNMKNINSVESVCDIQSKLSSMMVSLETNVQMVRKGLEGYVEEWCRMVKEDLKAKEKEDLKVNEKQDLKANEKEDLKVNEKQDLKANEKEDLKANEKEDLKGMEKEDMKAVEKEDLKANEKENLKANEKENLKANEKVGSERLENGLPSEGQEASKEGEKGMEFMDVDKTGEEIPSQSEEHSEIEAKLTDGDKKSPTKGSNGVSNEQQSIDIKESINDKKSEERIQPEVCAEDGEPGKEKSKSDCKSQAEECDIMTKAKEPSEPSNKEASSTAIPSSVKEHNTSATES